MSWQLIINLLFVSASRVLWMSFSCHVLAIVLPHTS